MHKDHLDPNEMDLEGSSRAPQHSVRYSFVKEQARDLREFGRFRPNPETTAGARHLSTQIFAANREPANPTLGGLAVQSVDGN